MLEEIGSQAFWNTPQLQYFVCLAEYPPKLESVLQDNGSGKTTIEAIFVPSDMLEDYRSADLWYDVKDKIKSEEDIPNTNQITVGGE